MLTLAWAQRDANVVTQWRGPDARVAVSALLPGALQLAAVIGPPGQSSLPGAAFLSGRMIVSIDAPAGTYDHRQTVAALGVNPAHTIFLALSAATDADENCAEMIGPASHSAVAGTNEITVQIVFSEPVTGPLILNWSAF